MTKGRKGKYEPERVKKILDAIELGATIQHACDYAGIHVDTFFDWQKRHPEFLESVKTAQGAGVISNLTVIKTASAENWTAAAWLLERRHPEEYGRRVNDNRNTHSGPNGTPIQIQTYDYATAAAALTGRSGDDRTEPGDA